MRSISLVLALAAASCAGPLPRPEVRAPEQDPSSPAFDADVRNPHAPPEIRRYPARANELIATDDIGHAVEAVTSLVATGSWEPDGRTAIYAEEGAIVVRHAPEVQGAVARLLACLKAHRQRSLEVKVRWVVPTQDQLVGLENLDPLHGQGGLQGVFDRARLNRLLEKWERDGARTLAAPKLALFHGQHGDVRVSNQMAYVCGWESQKPRSANVWDPIVNTVSDGLSVRVLAVANGEGREEFLVNIGVTQATLLDAPPEVPWISFGDAQDAPRRVEVPRVALGKLRGRFVMRPDQALVLLMANLGSREAVRPVIVTVIEADWVK